MKRLKGSKLYLLTYDLLDLKYKENNEFSRDLRKKFRTKKINDTTWAIETNQDIEALAEGLSKLFTDWRLYRTASLWEVKECITDI